MAGQRCPVSPPPACPAWEGTEVPVEATLTPAGGGGVTPPQVSTLSISADSHHSQGLTGWHGIGVLPVTLQAPSAASPQWTEATHPPCCLSVTTCAVHRERHPTWGP